QYTTQDKGEEVLATGLIVMPTDVEEEMLTVLWEHFTLGLNDTCSPTAIGLPGIAHPVLFASLGNVVVAPDYIGMSGWRGESDTLHPYIIAEPTAIASLDSLRALHHFVEEEAPEVRIRKDHMVIWGASEGGFASLFTDRYLPHYAPEFESKATVAAIPPTDVLWLAQYGTTNLGETTLGILASITSMSQWYETEEPLSDILQPAIADIIVDELKNKCEGFEFIETIQSVEDIFLPGFIADVQNENDSSNWICAIKESGIITTSVPLVRDTPLLIVTGEDDPLLLPDPVREDIPRLCEQGYRVEYRECAGENHTGGAIRSLGEQWEWIEARVAGTPMDNVCVVQAPHDCSNE
ncbi:MAG: lipase family protein, partial [Myxococcota bacterium]|nr:lipase family protein [Myxococcota bacterium]